MADDSSAGVSIRHFNIADVEDAWAWGSDPNFTKYLTWSAYETKDALRSHIEEAAVLTKPGNEMWGIELDKRLVGSIHAIERQPGCVQFGYGVLPQLWGNGITAEACRLAIAEIQKHWTATELWADIHIDNINGAKVARQLGFELSGASGEDSRDRWTLLLSRRAQMNRRVETLERFHQAARANEDVVAAFVAGSTTQDEDSEWSDIDVYLVVDEPDLDKVQADLSRMVHDSGKVIGLFPATSTHWFALYENLVVLDIGLITCVTYRSLEGHTENVLFDRRAGFLDEQSAPVPGVADDIAAYGVVVLTRIASKIHAGDYWLVPRFAASMRDRVLLPLLRVNGLLQHAFPGEREISLLPEEIRTQLALTFGSPDASGAQKVFDASAGLLRLLAERAQDASLLSSKAVFDALDALENVVSRMPKISTETSTKE